MSSAHSAPATVNPVRHAEYEDGLALLIGNLVISLGLVLFQSAGLLTGGVAGAAFLVHYATGVSFGVAFFLLNLPFYWLAMRRLGWGFTAKTVLAVACLSVLTEATPHFIDVAAVHRAYASVAGGVLLGMGFLVLFRHRASLGGVGILAVYLQERHGWRAGHVQMAIDCVIVAAAFAVVEPVRVLWSVAGVVVLNAILSLNHKPGRYVGY